jgi:2-phosphosulfolactate phosphatase
MQPTLNVYALPRYVEAEEFRGGTAVVIDVLRAGTTIVAALAAGAREVIPCLEVEDALKAAEQFPEGDFVLGGERGGMSIEGFHLGNSPTDYSPDAVAGKTVILTTTNGTRAMFHARQADEILIASLTNASAVARMLFDRQHVHILCAGTDGNISHDDVLLAGLLVERLQRQGGMVYRQNGQAVTARETWLHAFALPQALGVEPLAPELIAEQLRKGLGGQNLLALGMKEDILAAAQMDQFDIVPRLDMKTFRICIT